MKGMYMSTYCNRSCVSIKPCVSNHQEDSKEYSQEDSKEYSQEDSKEYSQEDSKEYNQEDSKEYSQELRVPRPVILVDEVSIGGDYEFHIIAPPSMHLISGGFLQELKVASQPSAGILWIVPITKENITVSFKIGKHMVDYPLHSFLFAAAPIR